MLFFLAFHIQIYLVEFLKTSLVPMTLIHLTTTNNQGLYIDILNIKKHLHDNF
jgi:hypothetical protein